MVNSDDSSDDDDDNRNVDDNDNEDNNEIMGLRDPRLGLPLRLRDLHIEAFTIISTAIMLPCWCDTMLLCYYATILLYQMMVFTIICTATMLLPCWCDTILLCWDGTMLQNTSYTTVS